MVRVRSLYAGIIFSLSLVASAQEQASSISERYSKMEMDIPMRDGVKLYTAIYTPKKKLGRYPILMTRTPYGCAPYGGDKFPAALGPDSYLMEEGYIFVYQDVRGRWKSEGSFDNLRPFIPGKTGRETDEATDTYDTIEWLLRNIESNGKAGMWGVSYAGFYAAYGLLAGHPALKAVSPQAPIADFFFDGFHHNGAFSANFWNAISLLGYQRPGNQPTERAWYKRPSADTDDQFQFFLENTPISKLDAYFGIDNFFWQDLKAHPNYDDYWKSRNLAQYLENTKIKAAVLTVGGLFDAQNLYGTLKIYEAIEKNPENKNFNSLILGPWANGDWTKDLKSQSVGNIYFGENISSAFQKDYEAKFFNHFLKKDDGRFSLPEARVFDTGKLEWNDFPSWPPPNVEPTSCYLGSESGLTDEPDPGHQETFISDPRKPVPYSEFVRLVLAPKTYMTDDQRFAAGRPDVLVYETPPLEAPIKLSGSILAKLMVATTGTDADWVVKLIDVFPPDTPNTKYVSTHLNMSNYHMMVRSDVIRGRFRTDFEQPEPFLADEKTAVELTLNDLNHTFLAGHRIEIQIQSTWFPLIDINPQSFVPNIFLAKISNFKSQTHTVYGDSEIVLPVLRD